MPLRTLLTSLVILAVLAPPALARSGRSYKGATAVGRATVMLACGDAQVWLQPLPNSATVKNITVATIPAGTTIHWENRPDGYGVPPITRAQTQLRKPMAPGASFAIGGSGPCTAWYVRKGPALQAAPIER